MIQKCKSILYATAGASLLAISFNYHTFWFLGLIAFLPFLYVLYTRDLSTKKVFLYGWFFGAVYLLIVLSWVWGTLPLDWLGVSSGLISSVLVFAFWIINSLALSFFVGPWALIFYKYKRSSFFDVFLVAALWILFEYIRLWGFSLTFMLGSGSIVGPHFSSGFVGYILAANHNLLQIADLGGVYTLSFVVVFINGLIYWLLFLSKFSLKRKLAGFLISLIVFSVLVNIPLNHLPMIKKENKERTMKVAVLNTYFPSTLHFSDAKSWRVDVFETLLASISQHNENIEIIIFPEDSRFISSFQHEEEAYSLFANIFGGKEKLIIDSGKVKEFDETRSRISYISTTRGELSTFDKLFLIPGEYVPYYYEGFLRIIGQTQVSNKLNAARGYSKGDGLSAGEYHSIRIGTLFCSEAYSPSLYTDLTREHSADFLVNVSSHAWFHGSELFFRQTQSVAKVRAVESDRYYIQASNFVPSYVVDNTGRVVKQSSAGKASVLYAEVKY